MCCSQRKAVSGGEPYAPAALSSFFSFSSSGNELRIAQEEYEWLAVGDGFAPNPHGTRTVLLP